MIEIKGDLWNQNCDALCITTNGFVKKNGEAVMGKGCAKQACERIPELARRLGHSLNIDGNNPSLLGLYGDYNLYSFPVKSISEKCLMDRSNVVRHMRDKFNYADDVPGWACVAREELIVASAQAMVDIAYERNYQKIVLPRPGCGAGELKWENICPMLSALLDDRFYVITY